MRPGITVRPPRSITFVDGPASLRRRSELPVADICPASTASASATDEAASWVMILPLMSRRSAGLADAGTVPRTAIHTRKTQKKRVDDRSTPMGKRIRSVPRHQNHIVHEQGVDAGLAERDDRIGRCANDRLAVVERGIDDEGDAGFGKEGSYQLVKARI